MDELSLIDVSAEDDFLLDLASPPQHPDPPPRAAPGTSVVGADLEHPAGGSKAVAAGQDLDPSGATEQVVPERTESPKKRKPKGGVNLRKSLAWDSAFFTGEGVLDTEELGIVNSTFRKAQGSRLLPGIAEEMRRSSESTTSTIESESFLLESLDSELFDNVRASVQRTLGKPDKAPAVTAASSKPHRATAKAPPVTARKGVDRIPQTQSKIRPPGSTSNGGVGSKQRPQVTSKEPTVTRVALPRAAEAKPSSRPPRALPRVATMGAPANTAATSEISGKRSSTGGVVNRLAVGKSANTSAGVPSRPGGGTKTSSTTKSGAFPSAVIPSSHGAPIGTMPGAKTKSPTLLGKTRTAQRIPIRSSSRSDISKAEPARASRNKIPPRSNIEGASPTISPSSSVDSMSSVISGVSTASTVGRASHTSESFSTRSSSLSPSTRKSNDHPPTTKSRPLTVTDGTPCDNLKSNIDTSTHGKSFKPSGLRRPTPKIGYFDAEKSVEQKAARVQMQSTNVLFSPLATPNPRTSTPKANFEFSAIDQQELKSMAAAVSQTKASPSMPLRVAQTEVAQSKVAEHEASQIKALTSQPLRVESSKVTEHEASPTELLPSLPFRAVQTEATKPEASPLLPLGVTKTEVEPSKVTEHESSQTEVEPSKVTEHESSQTEVEPSKVTEHEASQTEASPLLPVRVAETEVDSSKVPEHEAHMLETGPLVAVDIAEESIPALHQNVKASGEASLSTVELSSSTFGQQESETTAAPHDESSPSQAKVSPSLSIEVVKMELEPSEVIDHEACMPQACPPSSTFGQQESEATATPHEESSPSQTKVSPSLSIEVVKMELEPSEVKACMPQACPPSSTFGQQESEATATPHGESSPSQTKVSPSLSIEAVKMELEPSEVIDHEACMPQACPPSSTFGQQVSEATATPHEESSPSQTKILPSLSVEVAKMQVETSEAIDHEACVPQACSMPLGVAEMELEPSEVIDREACMAHACPVFADGDTAKENIPVLHQNIHPSPLKKNILASQDNIQAEGDMTPVKGTILASHPNVQAMGDMTPVTLLAQKLSSISLAPANGDATPLTLLAQKLSSISLGDATD